MKKFFWIIPITIAIVILMALISGRENDRLVAPGILQNLTKPKLVSSSTPVPTPSTPKTFQFDSSTDLKMELEKVNPEVLDSDFE